MEDVTYRPLVDGDVVQTGDEVQHTQTRTRGTWYPARTSLGCSVMGGFITNHDHLTGRRPVPAPAPSAAERRPPMEHRSCDGCQHAIDAGHPDDMLDAILNRVLSPAAREIRISYCNPCCIWVEKTGFRKNYKPAVPKPKTSGWSKWTNDV